MNPAVETAVQNGDVNGIVAGVTASVQQALADAAALNDIAGFANGNAALADAANAAVPQVSALLNRVVTILGTIPTV
jgi:F0F1-type ATP synthase beta subunit